MKPLSRSPLLLAVLWLLTTTLYAGERSPEWTDERAQERKDAIDAVFADIRTDTPGVAVAVVQGTEVVYLETFGLANLEHSLPITTETVFDIASISKQFGAFAALLLESEGLLNLDDLAMTHVPELPSFGADVTLKHLLNHTGGIRDWPLTLKIAGVEFDDVISFEKIMRMLNRQAALNFPAGTAYAYSNTGYNLLAQALANASGKTFRELTSETVFQPLGMHASFFLDDYREVVPNLASSYTPGMHGWHRNFDQLTALASSSLHTTIADFTRWMVNFETRGIGGAAVFEKLTRRGLLNDGSEIDYALGISHASYRGLPTLRHGGSWAGFRTTFVRFPTEAVSIAVFANYATAIPTARAERVADIVLADVLGPVPVREMPTPAQTITLDFTADLLGVYSGDYYSAELDTTYSFHVAQGVLIARHFRNPDVRLTATGVDTFRGDQWWFRDVSFVRNTAGEIDGFEINADRVRHLRFERRR